MLAEVCRDLASRGWRVSVLARHTKDLGTGVGVFECDYTEPGSLESGIDRATREFGIPTLWVTWIHSHAREAEQVVSGLAGRTRRIRVLGSGHTKTPAQGTPDAGVEAVQLGFVIEQGKGRWLTHAEISKGVIRAIDVPSAHSVVGVLEPEVLKPS